MTAYLFLDLRQLKIKVADLTNIDELTLKRLTIINKFGDAVVKIEPNYDFSGIINLYNKSRDNTICINGGNKDEIPGILVFKAADKISFAMMPNNNGNIFNIYNDNGLDVVSVGSDKNGHGGYSIKNSNDKIIKTEGWGWRAYKY